MSSPEDLQDREDGQVWAPQWLPVGVEQASPTTTINSSSTAWQWSESFWEEPDESGAELVREDVLIVEQINNFAGHFEHGKTMIVGDLAARWALQHGPVLYLDWEMGSRRVRRRMKAHGWTWDLARRNWFYGSAPRLDKLGGTLEDIAELVMEDRGDELLIVLDSFSAAMMAHGIEENSATEVGGWWDKYLRPVTESHGATIALISQVSQNAGQTSAYAQRGSGATAFGSDVIWMVERMATFSPEKAGEIRLTRHKDREGVLPPIVGYDVGGGGHEQVPIVRRDNVTQGAPGNEILAGMILEALQEGGPTAPSKVAPSQNYNTVVATLKTLKAQGRVVQYKNPQGVGDLVELAQPTAVPDAPPLN